MLSRGGFGRNRAIPPTQSSEGVFLKLRGAETLKVFVCAPLALTTFEVCLRMRKGDSAPADRADFSMTISMGFERGAYVALLATRARRKTAHKQRALWRGTPVQSSESDGK